MQFVLRHDRKRSLQFAPLQGPFGGGVIARHPPLARADSVVWVDDPGGSQEQVFVASRAAGKVLHYLGGAWTLLLVFGVVPRPIRDSVYRLVARHRHRIPLAPDACVLPDAADRDRFLD